ncbi:hypothetical protein BGZ92_006556 [Podila epicladia]|nr:hypothetical protein BGZ92_006556 [Podila epicladia]
MVLHQRTKQAFQSKDLSVAYSPCWSTLTAPFTSQTHEPLVAAWLHFVNESKQEQEKYGRTTFQQQAAAFKKLDHAAKTQKDKDSGFLNQVDFQKAFSQFIAYYYFASSKLASRKQVFSLIQSLQPYFQPNEADQDGIVVSALRSVIMADILAISGEPMIEIDMALHQKALCLYTTLDYAMGRAAILADIDAILDQLSHLLHARVLATNVQTSRDQVIGEHAEAMQDLEFVLKLILAIISRLIVNTTESMSSTPTTINKYEMSPTKNSVGYIVRILNDAITVSSSPAYHRDVSSISGMIFANLIDLTTPDVMEVARRTIGLVFGNNNVDTSFLPAIPKVMVQADYGWSTYLGEKCGPGEEDAGMYMLGIVRGLLTNIRQEALVMPVEDLDGWYAPEVFGDLNTQNLLLHEVLFQAIAYLCATSKDMSSKTSAFETMGHWLQQTKLHLGEKSTASLEMKQGLASCFNNQAQEKLITYVLDYWEDPVDTVQHKVKTILELLLDIVYLKAQLQKETGTPTFVTQILHRVLMADGHRKSKHPILAILVARVPIAEVVSLRHDALAQAILALEQLATAPGAAVAINAMVSKAWKECMELDMNGAQILKPVTKQSGSDKADDASMDSADDQLAARRKAIQPWVDFWLKPITQALTTDDDIIRKHLGHFIFSPLFSTCPDAFWILLEVLNDSSHAYSGYISDEKYRFNAIVLTIKIARSLDLVDANNYVDLTSSAANSTNSKIDISILRSAMHHASSDIRIDVLGILCESRRSTTPVASVEYELLKQFLPLNLNAVVPDFRQKLYSHLAKFLFRVRGNCYVLAREIARLHTSVGKKNLTEQDATAMIKEREVKVAETKAFLEWLLEHIFSSMYPGASFQRVSTSLRLLGMIIKTFGIETTPLPPGSKPNEISRFPFQLPIASEEHSKILLGCLLNPFDHCRSQALEILMSFKAPFTGYSSKESVDGLVRWGLDWLKSTRAGESDSGGLVLQTIFVKYAIELGWDIQLPHERLNSVAFAKETDNPAVNFTIRLQNLLRMQLEKAKLNQLDAAHNHPMHGTLIGLRYLFSSIDYASPLESIDAVISSSGGDEFEQSGGPNHQVILSYCWRAVKESSALMELVLSKATLGSSALKVDGILSSSALDRAGALFRRLLTTIRHPGAFSSVFPAYISLCTRLLNSEDPALAPLPRVWLEENLDAILSDAISVTRRSAGLPLCILAIVNAELSDNRRTLLPMVMRRVMAIAVKPVSVDANQQVDLPQIHAMNVLRRLFMDAKLSTSVLPYVGQGLELSIRAFMSPSWAVRNCGVMLFSTLLHRVFGAKRVRDEHLAINGITSRELFARLEGLCGFLQSQLEVAVGQLLGAESSQDRVHPGLYPVLTLLSRLQPSLHADPADAVDGGMAAFVTLVRRCAASAIWKTREMAARALIPLVASRDLMDLIVDILQGCMKYPVTQNEIHGLLVQVQFLLRGHLLGEGVADREVRRDFVTRFAAAIGPVTQRVLRQGCQLNQWMILSIHAEFVLGEDWMGRDLTEAEEGADQEMESEREEMKRLSHLHFKDLRDFIVATCVIGIIAEKDTYRQQIGGHLVRRTMVKCMMAGTCLGVGEALPKSSATNVITDLLEDSDYEVRLETLESLDNLLRSNREGVEAHFDLPAIHNTLIEILFKGEENLECLRLEVAMISSIDSMSPFPHGCNVDIVEFWNRLFMCIDDQATGGVAVAEAILPAIGNVFAQIWIDPRIDQSLRIDCLNRWANSIHKHANEYQTLQLREASLESIAFFTNQLLDPEQSQPTEDVTRAYLRLLETLIWQLQDDEVEVREEAAQIVSTGFGLSYEVSAEKALTLVYEHQLKLFAGEQASEAQVQMLVESLVSGIMGIGKPGRIVAESLQPSKMLFDKESPNLYCEPLVSMQLTERSLEHILAKSYIPQSVRDGLASYQLECVKQVKEVQKAIDEWRSESEGEDRSPWGVSGRKTVFEILWKLASGSSLLKAQSGQYPEYMKTIHDRSVVYPVVANASRYAEKSSESSGRLFLIE